MPVALSEGKFQRLPQRASWDLILRMKLERNSKRRLQMIRKVIGTILLLAACGLALVLLNAGMIFPHLVGPIVLAVTGVLLLTFKKKADRSAE
jgi:Flp pilus assembly protein TadB